MRLYDYGCSVFKSSPMIYPEALLVPVWNSVIFYLIYSHSPSWLCTRRSSESGAVLETDSEQVLSTELCRYIFYHLINICTLFLLVNRVSIVLRGFASTALHKWLTLNLLTVHSDISYCYILVPIYLSVVNMDSRGKTGMVLLSGNSHPSLTQVNCIYVYVNMK